MKNRTDLINLVAEKIGAKSYLEIGVYDGVNFINIEVENKTGVDDSISEVAGVKLENVTSDQFFESNKDKYDLIFIDGDHSFEQSSNDLANSIYALNEGGAIMMHDCYPKNEKITGSFKNGSWCGDVYKTVMECHQSEGTKVRVWAGDFGVAIITLESGDVGEEMELSYKNIDKGLKVLNTAQIKEYLDYEFGQDVTEETLENDKESVKKMYKELFPNKRIGRKSLETMLKEIEDAR